MGKTQTQLRNAELSTHRGPGSALWSTRDGAQLTAHVRQGQGLRELTWSGRDGRVELLPNSVFEIVGAQCSQ